MLITKTKIFPAMETNGFLIRPSRSREKISKEVQQGEQVRSDYHQVLRRDFRPLSDRCAWEKCKLC